jgi:hypothetical protein
MKLEQFDRFRNLGQLMKCYIKMKLKFIARLNSVGFQHQNP